VDAAAPGDEIVVTNGVYATGGRAVHGLMTNRVTVDKPVTVRSYNGPEVTVIQGQGSVTTFGDGAIRCVYLASGAVLSGFTLTNGATRHSGNKDTERSGGGAYGGRLTNCVLTGNAANQQGGGAYGSMLHNCTLTGNAGGYKGGGACLGTLYNCVLTGNSAGEGGGASLCTLQDCDLRGNSAAGGGGACCSVLNNCTLIENSAQSGGGAGYSTTLNNCIVYYNRLKSGMDAENSPRLSCSNHQGATLNFCCTTPMPTNGMGNITNEPRFVNWATGNLRLQPGSPCIDAGTNAHVASPTDLDGRPRIVGKTVDMGAYEF
jgi:hypothetical protein